MVDDKSATSLAYRSHVVTSVETIVTKEVPVGLIVEFTACAGAWTHWRGVVMVVDTCHFAVFSVFLSPVLSHSRTRVRVCKYTMRVCK